MPTYEIMVSLNKQIKVEAKDEEDAKDKALTDVISKLDPDEFFTEVEWVEK